MFGWALEGEIIEANPIAAMKGPKPPEARDRVLTDDEMRAFWQAAREDWPFENIFSCSLTGQRRNEVAAMRWRELDLGAGTWTFAPDPIKTMTKTGAHGEPSRTARLTPSICTRKWFGLLDATPCMRSEDFMFSTTGHSVNRASQRAKRRLDERMQTILGGKFQPWRVHDLRRTAATGMAALGFPRDAVGRVLNTSQACQTASMASISGTTTGKSASRPYWHGAIISCAL